MRRVPQLAAGLFGALLALTAPQAGADALMQAIADPTRSQAHLACDVTERPFAVLGLLNLHAGADIVVLARDDGYHAALASRVVGDAGRVWWVDGDAEVADNVTSVRRDALASLTGADAALWSGFAAGTAPGDIGSLLSDVAAALVPGGIAVLVDWQARPEAGGDSLATLGRTAPSWMQAQAQTAGMMLETQPAFLEVVTDTLNDPASDAATHSRYILVLRKRRAVEF